MKVMLNTGTIYAQVVELDTHIEDDWFNELEEHVMENEEDFATYSFDELMVLHDEDETYIDDMYMPINGGEYYIGAIAWVTE